MKSIVCSLEGEWLVALHNVELSTMRHSLQVAIHLRQSIAYQDEQLKPINGSRTEMCSFGSCAVAFSIVQLTGKGAIVGTSNTLWALAIVMRHWNHR